MKTTTLQARREKIADYMAPNSMTIILSGNEVPRTANQFHEFIVWRNFLYLTNIDRFNMALVILKKGDDAQTYLFIDQVSELEEKWSGYRMKKHEASELSGACEANILNMNDFELTLGKWMNDGMTQIYMDLERNTYSHPDTEQIILSKALQGKYPYLTFNNLHGKLATMRRVKSQEEIDNMRVAIEKTRKGIESMMKNAKPGMYEYEVEAYYDFAWKFQGVKQRSFHTIAASGKNATVLHYNSNDAKTGDDDLILMDLGCYWNGYAADITRTFPVSGKYTPRQREVYEAVLDVQKQMIEAIKPGVKTSEMNEMARELLGQKCVELGLIDDAKDVAKHYYHLIGHSIGLDVHDVGGREFTLEPGMVMTIEPGLYIEDENIGIRIEDNILVTETGHENLSKDIIKEVADIEAFMKR